MHFWYIIYVVYVHVYTCMYILDVQTDVGDSVQQHILYNGVHIERSIRTLYK